MYQKGRIYPLATLMRILIVTLAVASVSGTFKKKSPAPQQPVYYHPAPAPPPVVYHPAPPPRPPPQKPPQVIIVPVQTYPVHPAPPPRPVYPPPRGKGGKGCKCHGK